MKTKGAIRFDIDILRDLAGERVFARGEAYHRGGHVEILSHETERVLAHVAGTEDYRVVLTRRGEDIDGECSCPAFERGFCKHMVATALAVNAAGGGGETEGAGPLARIRDHLKARGVDALVDMIVDMAERDPALLRRLDMAAAAECEDEETLETRYRKAIDDATRTRGFVDYARTPGWAANVEAALDALAGLPPAGRGAAALKLAERAIDRIERAMENIDDSGGHCSWLLHRARDIHLDAARAARPEPVAFAGELFAREMEDDYDTFSGAAALYAAVLGEEGLAEYHRLAMEAWDKLPSRMGARRDGDAFFSAYYRLASMVDFFAEREGDIEMRIALRAKDLSSPWNYLKLAEFCLAHDRADEALARAEEGLWMFEDGRPDERLLFFTVDLQLKVKCKSDAEAHLWRAFEKVPSFEIYERLCKLGRKGAQERAIELLRNRLAGSKPSPWNAPADLFIRVLIHEKMHDAAWAAARKHGASRGLKEALAKASEKTHSREALEVYVGRIEELVASGGNANYEEACEFVSRMGALQDSAEHAAYVADLRERHRRKRNFMKLLG